ncbi:MAG: hypothetical protein JKY82_11565 [Rhizobiaceae bacterium]|nr:hypothetical protein [Rhizobiaceae bacterium]MBL4733210.1 hypothetical protein [Rhizobiaceae bacterium]
MEQESNYTRSSDEIDLIEIFSVLWEGKFWILLATVGMLALGYGYLSLPNLKLKALVKIEPLLARDLAQYDSVNNQLQILGKRITLDSITDGENEEPKSKRKTKKKDKNNSKKKSTDTSDDEGYDVEPHLFNAPNFLSKFTDELMLRQTMSQAILDTGFALKGDAESDGEFHQRVAGIANEFIFTSNENNLVIEFKTSRPAKARELMAALVMGTNKAVLNSISKSMTSLQELFKIRQVYNNEDLMLKRSNSVEDYERETEMRLAYLNEQLQLARVVGIEKNTLEAQNLGPQFSVVSSPAEPIEELLYLRGYLAIEKEIALINSRDNKENFIEDITEIDQKIRSLTQDKTVERFIKAQIAAKLTLGEFRAVFVDVDAISFKPRIPNIIFLVICGFLGMVGGSIVYVLWRGVRKYRLKASEAA